MRLAATAALLLAACHKPPPSSIYTAESVQYELATDPGMSGLTVDEHGALWGVSERAHSLYQIELDGTVHRHDIPDAPAGLDLESVAALPGGEFAYGTEGAGPEDARVLLPTGAITIQVEAAPNKGIEGVCAWPELLLAGAEVPIEQDGARLGQVVLVEGDRQQLFHVVLTSATGKLADLSCTLHDDRIDVLALERHYEVSRIIGFTIPRGTPPGDPIAATVVRDLTATADGRNFEGLARLPDGRLAVVNDNQHGEITGPTQLLLLYAP